MSPKKALTIAGSDTSGGAGIQADLKTFQELGVYGMTALNVVVAQDPHRDWFHEVFLLPNDMFKKQLETVVSGIGVDALKTGMLASVEAIQITAEHIEKHHLQNVVIDPVMVCKGAKPLHPELASTLQNVLVPKATVVTPNLFEAAQLASMEPITTVEHMMEAAHKIQANGAKYVIVKGGGKLEHENAVDVLYDGNEFEVLESERIETTWTHGAGCTFSAAITAELAKGKSPRDAILTAKDFITEAIASGFELNQYVGPTWHGAYRDKWNK
ncbi:pyridoxine/pyridoxal/pyridoxamine kinase [Fictibacillus phosphorivorans]|uniref:pyridoxine/pyridoxal/pyridoxamine kinase n=1 Tax=Fictibacillus phosphorivorans TaxID=1221500 RepID=UPI00203C4817|nr:pyridoxine/pyridoxal/pyridoxamine kinase [Fictibacillus phosphorivorans]MCM3719947.1 pyridoxine/pyridoxal/pyridoxamine kinase [Fictibacillus phosphorivorans]MCM3777599.1 pyridoxine/pyridoxal/pyridoxamine kinase [Fictibacillus phosphorivorans]